MYFGRTLNPDPNKYIGSGVHWKNHLKKYGKSVTTIFFEKFDSLDDAKEFAEFFSEEFDIVNSSKWANLIIETAEHTSYLKGHKMSKESLLKMSKAQSGKNNPNFGKITPEETKLKIKESNLGLKRSEETKQKISDNVKKQYKQGKVSPLKGLDKSGKNNSFYGKSHSEETKLKISLSKIGKSNKQDKIFCPHCNKVGGKSLMKRWHLDNCKYKVKDL